MTTPVAPLVRPGRVRGTGHEVLIPAPADVVYGLIADATRWPSLLGPSVHVEPLDFDGRTERLRMWALVGGRVHAWYSRRVLSPAAGRVDFRQESPTPSAGVVSGTWTVEPGPSAHTRLTLALDVAADGGGAGTETERGAVDDFARAMLEDVRRAAADRSATGGASLSLSFEDSLRVNGPAELVLDFLYRVGDWPGVVPHVGAVRVVEDAPGVQRVSVDGSAPGGPTHTGEWVRMCFPHAGRIVFKQTVPSPLLRSCRGEWSVVPDERGATVVARHGVVLDERGVERVLGGGAGLREVRAHVRAVLGDAGVATMNLAKRHAESAVRMLGARPLPSRGADRVR
ncbi:SRPBCC family protein [Streptomyces sp. NPDC044948]|uniref:aromatase/cyclase n=1 Tax=Streptomyces sp. NPDC044948 TaxID=3157092 RepID=UPI0033DFCE97